MEIDNRSLREKIRRFNTKGHYDVDLDECICETCEEFSISFPSFFNVKNQRIYADKGIREDFEEKKERFVRHVNIVHLGYNRHNKEKDKAYS
jgi:hypothetical protein